MREMKVKNSLIENTGGNVFVGYGQFENGKYFAISDDILIISDKDIYKAHYDDNIDDYEWEQENLIDRYSFDTEEHTSVLKQVDTEGLL